MVAGSPSWSMTTTWPHQVRSAARAQLTNSPGDHPVVPSTHTCLPWVCSAGWVSPAGLDWLRIRFTRAAKVGAGTLRGVDTILTVASAPDGSRRRAGQALQPCFGRSIGIELAQGGLPAFLPPRREHERCSEQHLSDG